jgi:hypothetical protein
MAAFLSDVYAPGKVGLLARQPLPLYDHLFEPLNFTGKSKLQPSIA